MSDWLQSWMDTVCEVMAVTDGNGQQVRSFYVFKINELPDAIKPDDIPCAYSYATSPEVQYSLGGPLILRWKGRTEFHLTRDVKPSNIPYILPFFETIVRACAAKMQLGGIAEIGLFTISQNTPDALMFATYKNAKGDDDHQGVVLNWELEQRIEGDLVVAQ